MRKVTVKICTGTLCYLMGGAELQLLDEHLSPEMLLGVDIQGAPCLGCCTSGESANAPYAMVNDRMVEGATLSKVIDVIREELEK